MPIVLNKRRDKIPPDAVYAGRPGIHGNKYRIGQILNGKRLTREDCVRLHKRDILEHMREHPDELLEFQRKYRGRDWVCWCAPLPCHADVLLELANRG